MSAQLIYATVALDPVGRPVLPACNGDFVELQGVCLRQQRGITLIVVMIMLVLISLASTSAMRSSANSEVVANSARTQSLAFNAAEAGLRYCERIVQPHMEAMLRYFASLPSATATTPTIAPGFVLNAAPVLVPGGEQNYQWKAITATWDINNSPLINIVPLTEISATSTDVFEAYRRSPECLAEYSIPGYFGRAVITARGFGPEVPAGRGRPTGSEVWLQSTLQVAP